VMPSSSFVFCSQSSWSPSFPTVISRRQMPSRFLFGKENNRFSFSCWFERTTVSLPVSLLNGRIAR
jgi:hypothetical protein